ncbi:hypothetical protein A2924_01830 [Candidatus Giovannonibacteria bacterium RIFCSPLOWO2_01_FULL_44_16]|uniref:PH domain-containing protein n=1 Tax=Candidatus Giovannonibacteria bacterium RIFCSPLOWO2_01_FULL_44_16 TaxID=1798348 RepID=A0A1F5X5L6_9BACT|nr:MAG: hypothetical protein A2924_01830 [Candidatus Giovannonibacteria bacterium RIFCSPLOWO2_01_FULL_44_16]
MVAQIATIPKHISKGEELVVLKRSDFEVYQKWQEQINDALSKVKRGREEYKKGKTIRASSSRELR